MHYIGNKHIQVLTEYITSITLEFPIRVYSHGRMTVVMTYFHCKKEHLYVFDMHSVFEISV